MAQTEMVRKPCDPRPTPQNPRKRVRNSQQPRGEPQGFEGKGKGRAKDDDEVSLDYSGDEFMEGYHDDDEMEEIDTVGIGVFSHLENVGNMSWLGQIFPGYSNQENCWIIYCAY